MKNVHYPALLVFILATFLLSALTSCGGQKTQEKQEVVYACPMHPDVKGKEGDKCSQCGMNLEKVEEKEKEGASNHEQH